MRNAAFAVIVLFSPLAVIGKTFDQLVSTSGTDLHEFGETDHPGNNFWWGSVFYLAQTHRDLGNNERSLDLYRQRVELGGWDEEVFWSHYQAGIVEDRMGWESATDTLAAAWDRRPTRAEPVYHLARINRLRRRHHLSWVWANVAASIPRPEDTLFVEEWVYRWAAPFELADAAWRIGHPELALSKAKELLQVDDLPQDHREHVEMVVAAIVADQR